MLRTAVWLYLQNLLCFLLVKYYCEYIHTDLMNTSWSRIFHSFLCEGNDTMFTFLAQLAGGQCICAIFTDREKFVFLTVNHSETSIIF